jgi:ketosteroid isomerase-like protein
VPACVVCTVKNGRITRLDEYLDTAQLAPLSART